jgi:hypothetical protein
LEAAVREEEKHKAKPLVDSPSPGVKVIAWFFLAMAVVTFGLALLILGVTLFSRRSVPMMNWIGGVFPTLDDIPGGRRFLGWFGFLTLAASGVEVFVGMGLLNCLQAARRMILIFSWIEVLVAGFGWFVVLALKSGFWDIPVLAVVFIYFFSRKDVRRQFERNSELIEVHR